MSLNERLYAIVPLISLLCNLFLFLTFLTAKKNKMIWSIMLLLLAFILWAGGSFFMRIDLYPGEQLWYSISIFGIFCTPFCLYNFIYCYTNQKGSFLRIILGVITIILSVMSLFEFFIKNPRTEIINGEKIFIYDAHWSVVIPFALVFACVFMAVQLVYRAVRYDGMSWRQFYPLFVGTSAMLLLMMVEAVPTMATFPNDTLGCMLYAICLYYALYKRRFITLTHINFRSSTFLVAATLTTSLLAVSFRSIDNYFNLHFEEFSNHKTMILAAFFSVCTMIVYQIFLKLVDNLFISSQTVRESELKKFSFAINRTLIVDEIIAEFMDFIRENMPDITAYICIHDDKDIFRVAATSNGLSSKNFSFPREHPVVSWLETHDGGIYYDDFKRTSGYKSMWDTEKTDLAALEIEFLLPIVCDSQLVGLALFSTEERGKAFTFTEANYLENVAAILSISIRNARMYVKMRNEARIDALTGLMNRRHFMETAEMQLQKADSNTFTLILFNLDDFHLFNELYGSQDGDNMLQAFSGLLISVLGERGMVARYGGKEFMAAMPGCDSQTAYTYTERVRGLLKQFLEKDIERTKKFLTFSAGICTYPIAAGNLNELITNVNFAVFRAKRTGKNQTIIYAGTDDTPDMLLANKTKSAILKKDIGDSYAATVYALTAAINAKDHYTFAHSANVSEYASILAEHLGLDREHVEIIRQAGLLHDIGKIGVPETILTKMTRLTSGEAVIMRGHVESAIEIIRYLPSLDYVIPVAIGHHEHWDGNGYPRGLKGENIPVGARCLCVVDSFDAMVSRRPYKEPMPVEDALREIERCLGRQFDPDIGALFVRLVRGGSITVRS